MGLHELDHALVADMRMYLLPLMKRLFGDKCQRCKQWFSSYDIDHKKYGPDVTVYDLQLLCEQCHYLKTYHE